MQNAFQLATKLFGKGKASVQLGIQITEQGRKCNYYSNQLKSVSLKKLAIEVVQFAIQQYKAVNDIMSVENVDKLARTLDLLQTEL